MKYIQKALAVEAMQCTWDDYDEIEKWSNGRVFCYAPRGNGFISMPHLRLRTSEYADENPIIEDGAWIVKSPSGVFNVYSESAFEESFEAVDA